MHSGKNLLLAGEMLKSAKQTFNISPVGGFFFCKSASGWGNVKNFFENVLLAGEMLKSAKQTFNISPVGAFFLFENASGWGNVKSFFKNVLLAGEILKKLKMLKVGGTMFVSRVCTNIVPPTFNIFNFFRISPARSTFSKKNF